VVLRLRVPVDFLRAVVLRFRVAAALRPAVLRVAVLRFRVAAALRPAVLRFRVVVLRLREVVDLRLRAPVVFLRVAVLRLAVDRFRPVVLRRAVLRARVPVDFLREVALFLRVPVERFFRAVVPAFLRVDVFRLRPRLDAAATREIASSSRGSSCCSITG
jgi:hypothetical protein